MLHRLGDLVFEAPDSWRRNNSDLEKPNLVGHSIHLEADYESRLHMTVGVKSVGLSESMPLDATRMKSMLEREFGPRVVSTGRIQSLQTQHIWGLVRVGDHQFAKNYWLTHRGRIYAMSAMTSEGATGKRFLAACDEVCASARQREHSGPVIFVSYSRRSPVICRFMNFALRPQLEERNLTYFDFRQYPIASNNREEIMQQIDYSLWGADVFLRLADQATAGGRVVNLADECTIDYLYDYELPQSLQYAATRTNRVQIQFPDTIGRLTPTEGIVNIVHHLGNDPVETVRRALQACEDTWCKSGINGRRVM